MSGHEHRQPSLEDSIVDHSKIVIALQSVEALKTEFDGVDEVMEDLDGLIRHLHEVEDRLKENKKLRVPFSAVTMHHLESIGVQQKHLILIDAKIKNAVKALTMNRKKYIQDLAHNINTIKDCVNLNFEPGSRVIDAVLLTLRKFSKSEKQDIAILPEIMLLGDGVKVTHPATGYELWLTGNVDYGVLDYDKVEDYHASLVGSGGATKTAFRFTPHHMCLIEAKCSHNLGSLYDCAAEAVSQAVAVLKSANLSEVHFCLTNGWSWVFYILREEHDVEGNTLSCYQSIIWHLKLGDLTDDADLGVADLMVIICEWLKPSPTGLYELEK